MPKFEPENPASVKKLLSAVEWSVAKKKPFDAQYVDFDKRRVGKHYGDSGFIENRPLNGFELACSTYQRALVSRDPQAMVESQYKQFRPVAADFELALNPELRRINLGDVFDTCALSALNMLGVAEIGITGSDTPPDGEGYLYDPGHVFADPVLFDDLILDMSVKAWDQMAYMGHEFSVPFEWVKENNSFNKNVRDSITTPDSTRAISEEHTGSTSQGAREEFDETIRLRQLYLYRYGLVLLFAVEQQENLPLKIIKWTGPEKGPYRRLSFGKVLGEIIPLSPMMNWFDLDDLANTVFNKCADQAERQKSFVGVNPAGADDGKTTVDAQDGGVYKFQDPKNAAVIKIGGVEQVNLTMVMAALEEFNKRAGNIEAIAGLAAQSGTIGQDELIAENASVRLKDMADAMMMFQTEVIRDIAFWMWHDPISEYHIQKPIGAGLSIDATFSPESRGDSDFFDYNIQINPYKKHTRSPNQQGEFELQLFERFLMPLSQQMQMEGKVLDTEFLVKRIFKLVDAQGLADCIQYMNGEMLPQAEPKGGMPPNTTRTYERVNKSEQTDTGMRKAMMRSLIGGKQDGSGVPSVTGAA